MHFIIAFIRSPKKNTIPVEIRRKLRIKEGDKVLFIEEGDRIYMMNSSMDALREAQKTFAEEVCLASEEDVISMIREFRRE